MGHKILQVSHSNPKLFPFTTLHSHSPPTVLIYFSRVQILSGWASHTADDILIISGSSCRELGGLLFARRFSPFGQTSNQEDKEYESETAPTVRAGAMVSPGSNRATVGTGVQQNLSEARHILAWWSHTPWTTSKSSTLYSCAEKSESAR
jgi:hypothetical protein